MSPKISCYERPCGQAGGFLKFNEREILNNAGKISHEVAEALALCEYEKYRVAQDKNYVSNFDRGVKNF